jgi:hypothetical protein
MTDAVGRFCSSCGAEIAPGTRFCVACGAPSRFAARGSAWEGFRAQRGWLQVVAWIFLSLPMAVFWIWSGSGWHVAGKIAASTALVVAFTPFMFA